jgi:hypothetical protein
VTHCQSGGFVDVVPTIVGAAMVERGHHPPEDRAGGLI